MNMRNVVPWVLCLVAMPVCAQRQEAERPTGGVVDFRAPILADPVMQHAKETYILYGCAYCHGVDLKVRNGEAADLLHDPLVGADVDANLIGKILRVGIPQTAKLSPMPQFSDLSDHEIEEIARWIHYSRQQGKLKELTGTKVSGEAGAGRVYFAEKCSACHTQPAMISITKKYDAAQLKQRLLSPGLLNELPSFKLGEDAKRIAAKRQHGHLLENYTPVDVANLMAYLQTLK